MNLLCSPEQIFLKTYFSKVSKHPPHIRSSPQQNKALSSSVTADQWERHGKMRVQRAAAEKCRGRIEVARLCKYSCISQCLDQQVIGEPARTPLKVQQKKVTLGNYCDSVPENHELGEAVSGQKLCLTFSDQCGSVKDNRHKIHLPWCQHDILFLTVDPVIWIQASLQICAEGDR